MWKCEELNFSTGKMRNGEVEKLSYLPIPTLGKCVADLAAIYYLETQ